MMSELTISVFVIAFCFDSILISSNSMRCTQKVHTESQNAHADDLNIVCGVLIQNVNCGQLKQAYWVCLC